MSMVLRYELPLRFNPAVVTLQDRLVALNHLPSGGADGYFGPATRKAVRRFQEFANLDPSGTVDSGTSRELGLSGANAIVFRPVAAMSRPPVWDGPLPQASPQRIILHWTAGGARASSVDRKHYHFLVQQDGTIVKGVHGIDANDAPKKGKYAAHTRNKNTKSIGLSLCGMAGARERPFNPGQAPFNKDQLQVLTRLAAQLCAHYQIPVTRETVLGHGEVQDLLGVTQSAKWDPMVLPWDPSMGKRAVGDMMRAMVQAELNLQSGDAYADDLDDLGAPLDILIDGQIVNGGVLDFDTALWTHIPSVADQLGWTITASETPGEMEVLINDASFFLPVQELETQRNGMQSGFIPVQKLAEELSLSVTLSDDGSLVTLGGEIGGALPADNGVARRQITIRPGDTLSAIARRELGDATKWRELLDSSGTPFTEAMALRLRAGDTVIIPGPDTAPARPKLSMPDDLAGLFAEAAAMSCHPLNRDAAREAAKVIIPACFEFGVLDLSHIAYIFATAEHETNLGRLMVEVWRDSAEQKKYETNPSNSKKGDGKKFKGRGFVQLTFRENYAKFSKSLGINLETDPDRAADPEIAAKVLVLGMDRMGYRSPKLVLKKYGVDGAFDFEAARQIVNADTNRWSKRYKTTRGKGIGLSAERYREAFRAAGIQL
ncbi:N-acetylmuramoyl-L-alanine amidase [Shimia ponticola]|uniref:N-acetylmuramoyl-L-alanine amidase n=1 Tax=Shimia ponticola TaxID=2582893 RepID=UPI00164BD778|nr:N-acetylmuramoyl-L-alanine amidase [Shimia ponticola]